MVRGGRKRWGAVAVVVLAVVGLAPIGSGAASAAKAPKRDLPVQHVTMTFVDRSRPTVDPTGPRSADTRTLVTEIYLPKARGRFPLIAFAHGNAGNPGKLTQLFSAWAAAGYVVVAPTFPLTNDLTSAPTVIPDYVNQPADVAFAIDRVLQKSRRSGSPLSHRIDARHIGLAGHSLGGATAYGLAFNSCCRDRRIDAVIAMDAVKAPFQGDFAFRGTPLLLIHLRSDPVVKYATSAEVFAAAAPPKYLMSLAPGIHFEPFEDAPSPHDAAVIAATTAFWDGYLRHDRAARREIVPAGTEPGLSDVQAVLR